ncbi:MAG: glycosyltransferase family 2 protein [Fervidobacterium sp.]|uniref:glycosyltransferase family 2 protein n=1 Tax=Fervidobacterium sp. TaxID=1871331 RepID=UPI00404B1EC8
MPKVSVLMPVYNDEKYLPQALESVLSQKDVELELIIVDDASKDSTPKIIEQFKAPNVKYIRHEENKGQLDALLTASQEISGDFVALFHGDDRISHNYALAEYSSLLLESKADGLYSDIILIDEHGNERGKLNVARKLSKNSLIELLGRAGSNIIGDPFFVTKEYFFQFVLENYVKWNMPYWFCEKDDELLIGRLQYVEHPWYVYRISSENYARSEVGKFVATNGTFRTITFLSKHIKLSPFFVLMPRVFIKLGLFYGDFKKSLYSSQPLRKQILSLIKLSMRGFDVDYTSNMYYTSLISFYSKQRNKVLTIEEPIDDHIFYGKDVNRFYRALRDGKVPRIYELLMKEAMSGYFEIETTEENLEKVNKITKFLNFLSPVRIIGK